jgi:hypothetical protein
MKSALTLLLMLAGSAQARSEPVVTYSPAERCTPLVRSARTTTAAELARGDALIAAFERTYPQALVDPATVDTVTIAPPTLRVLVDDLACLSTQPGGDPFVAEQAAALFASKRYGPAAFGWLARTGRTRFAQQMRRYSAARR